MLKHACLASLLAALPTAAQAQVLVPLSPELTQEIWRSTVMLLLLALLVLVLLRGARLWLEARLKLRLLELAAPPELAARLLPPPQLFDALRWACLLAAASAGLTAAYYLLPWGLLAASAFVGCLALGFGLYYLLQRRASRP